MKHQRCFAQEWNKNAKYMQKTDGQSGTNGKEQTEVTSRKTTRYLI